MNRVLIVIPARYHSTRLPAKLLKTIAGMSILEHVYNNCLSVEIASKVVVATDHPIIFEHCAERNIDVIMTSAHHVSGTDRVAEAARLIQGSFDYIVNVQGDEPMVQSSEIHALIQLMATSIAPIGTLYTEGPAPDQNNPNVVKLVTNKQQKVLYFSRSSIPYNRDANIQHRIKKHIGMYAFKSETLQALTTLSTSTLEKIEMLEQLRWLENNYDICATAVDYQGFGIDTQEDLDRARALMES